MMKRYNLYLDAFIKTIGDYKDNPNTNETKMYIKRAVFYGVKLINLKETYEKTTTEKVEETFQVATIIKSLIGLLTPGELITIFPIDKVYDGSKWETKDYFYTMDCINKLDPKKPIGEDNVLNLLWDYTNMNLMLFSINIMGYASKLRQLEGYPSIMDEWADMNGIETHTMHQDNKGNKFIIKDGKALKMSKSRPKHLKLIK